MLGGLELFFFFQYSFYFFLLVCFNLCLNVLIFYFIIFSI